MLLQVHPQEGFLLEGLARRRIGQQLIAERLQGAHFFYFTVIRKIHHTETALAQSAVNFVLATDDVALFVEFGGLTLSFGVLPAYTGAAGLASCRDFCSCPNKLPKNCFIRKAYPNKSKGEPPL